MMKKYELRILLIIQIYWLFYSQLPYDRLLLAQVYDDEENVELNYDELVILHLYLYYHLLNLLTYLN